MKNAMNLEKNKLLIFIIGLSLVTILILASCKPEYEKPSIDSLNFEDIAFLNAGKINFIDESGDNFRAVNIVVSMPKYFLGQQLANLNEMKDAHIVGIDWGNSGDVLGFEYSDPHYIYKSYIGVVNQEGTIFLCNNKYAPSIKDFQIIDGKRAIINTIENEGKKLINFNLETCEEEGTFYEGHSIGAFSLSNKSWLAVQEEKEGMFMMNIYDDSRNLLYSVNEDNYNLDLFSWSNDGNKLLYVLREGDQWILYMFKLPEKKTIKISSDVFWASFSPADDKLVLEKQNGIYLLDLNSMEVDFLIQESKPSWR